MNNAKIILMPSERQSNLSKERKEREAKDKERLFICMREIHEAAAAVGKPNILTMFLDSLTDIAIMWRLEDKGKEKMEGGKR